MIRCPQCQAEVAEGKRFCPQCGARLPEPPADAGRTTRLPSEGETGKTIVVPPEPPADVGRTVLLPPESEVGKTMVVPPAPPSDTPSSSAGLQTTLADQTQKPQPPATGVSPSSPPSPSGSGFGLPPSPPSASPTSPASGGGLGLPPSTPPASGGGFGLPSSAASPATGSPVAPPAATTPAKKGPNWLLIIGIILGVLVLACILILGVVYWVGQQAAQSLGTTIAGTAVSIGDLPASTDFPNVLLRDSLASEATSQFTAGQTGSGDYRFENGAFVIESFDTDQIVWQTIDEVVDDASFEIEATVSKPSSAAVALLFRYQDTQNFYILSVDGRGRYRVARYVDDAFSILSDWKTSPAINAAGSSNRLKIEMIGDSLTFYCNGQRLANLRDSAFRRGELAFGTETFDEGQGVVRFTNLLVRGR